MDITPFYPELLESVRVRIEPDVLKRVRSLVECMGECAGGKQERIEAQALSILLENYDKQSAVLAKMKPGAANDG